ncbi:hypothetical protein [Paratissierella segnis]|jgi:hypothetical protein|nr:hypothetical protein [Paratissierella segnis]
MAERLYGRLFEQYSEFLSGFVYKEHTLNIYDKGAVIFIIIS